MRLRYTQQTALSSTTAEDRDIGNVECEAVVDSLNEGGGMEFTLAAGVTNQNIQHAQVASAKYLSLRTRAVDPNQTPGDITVKLNDTGATPITVSPLDGKQGHMQLATSGVTALYASNPGSVPMRVYVAMAGD